MQSSLVRFAPTHRTRDIHYSRASYGQEREITECFVLLSVVYHDGAFKLAASDL